MFYNVMSGLITLLFRLTGRVRIEGEQHIPAEGPGFLIANHVSILDPVALISITKRPIHFMGKKELFKIPVLRRLFAWMNVFPVDRSKLDRGAIKKAIAILHDDGLLGVFPEGTRGDGKRLLPFKMGSAYIAAQVDAPVVPIAIEGGGRMLIPFAKPVRITVGEPLYYPGHRESDKRETMNDFLRQQERAIASLLKNNVE